MATLSLARWTPGGGVPPVWVPIHAPTELPRPDAGLVLLLAARLDSPAPDEESRHYQALLNHDERQRLARFRVEIARRRFLVGRGLIRTVLARALDCSPLAVPLLTGEYGKPVLPPGREPAPIHFNLSHSGEIVLIGFTGLGELGVDVEQMRPGRMIQEIMDRQFHPDERAAVTGDADFFRCWALKEAVVKALGRGLGYPTESFSVASILRGESCVELQLESRVWTCSELAVADTYAAALVLEGRA